MSKKAYVSYYDDAGKRCRIFTGLSIPQTYEGRVAVAELLMQKIIKEYVPVRSIEERAWAWIESRRPYLRKKSYYCYQSKLRTFLKWKGKRKLSRETITEYFYYRAGIVSGATLNHDKIDLNKIFKSITGEEFFDHLELPKFHSQTKQHYRRRHIEMIKGYLVEQDPDLWFACQCVYYLFIRPGSELRLLQVHHFDLDEWRVTIPPGISKNKKNEVVLIPEAFRDDVEVFLHAKAPSEYLFPGVYDPLKPIGANTMMNRYRRVMDILQFGTGFSMYSWKNTGAIACVKAGVHPKILQLQLRHSSLEMTDRYLRRMGLVDMGDLADKFPEL